MDRRNWFGSLAAALIPVSARKPDPAPVQPAPAESQVLDVLEVAAESNPLPDGTTIITRRTVAFLRSEEALLDPAVREKVLLSPAPGRRDTPVEIEQSCWPVTHEDFGPCFRVTSAVREVVHGP